MSKTWIFARDNLLGVQGSHGSSKVMFIGYVPSKQKETGGVKKDLRLTFFYCLLRIFGFKNAYITDLTRRRVTRGKKSQLFVKKHKDAIMRMLKVKINQHKPTLIVLVGKGTIYFFKQNLNNKITMNWGHQKLSLFGKSFYIEKIRHFAYLQPKPEINRLIKQMARLNKRYNSIK